MEKKYFKYKIKYLNLKKIIGGNELYYHCSPDSDLKISKLVNKNPNFDFLLEDLGKPNALWLGKGHTWISHIYNTSEKPSCYYYEIKFDPSKMITITSLDSLIDFHNEYAEEVLDDKLAIKVGDDKYNRYCINWKKVSEKYTGIIFEYVLSTTRLITEEKGKKITKPSIFSLDKITDGFYKRFFHPLNWASVIDVKSVAIFKPVDVVTSIILESSPKK